MKRRLIGHVARMVYRGVLYRTFVFHLREKGHLENLEFDGIIIMEIVKSNSIWA
jgi:hypothetical protein